MTAQITDPTVCQARQNFVNASRTGYVRVDTSVDDHYHSGFVSSRSSLVLLHTGPRLLTRIDRAGSHTPDVPDFFPSPSQQCASQSTD